MAKLNLQLKPRQVILLALGAIAVLVLFNCMSGKTSSYTAPTPSNGEPMIGGEDAEDEAPVERACPPRRSMPVPFRPVALVCLRPFSPRRRPHRRISVSSPR